MVPCLLYARVSDPRQEKYGFSIPAQREGGGIYAAARELEIVGEYVEAETARSTGREQFTAMLTYLRQPGSPKIVIVEKTDRFYRNLSDYVVVEDLINNHGLEVHFYKEHEVFTKDSTSHAKLMHGIKVLMAKNYIDNLSEEIRKGQRQKAMGGEWGHMAPYGYQKVEGQLVISPDTAPFMRRAFELYATGFLSLKACAQRLHDEGYTYRSYRPKITPRNLHTLLSSRIYVGEIEYKGDIYPAKHAPLVDQETWQAVQKAFERKTKPISDRKFMIFRGLLKCGQCGAQFSGEIKRGGKYVYYRCARGANNKDQCQQGYTREEVIESTVAHSIKRMAFPPQFKAQFLAMVRDMDTAMDNTANDEIARISNQVQKLRDRLKQAYHDKLDGQIDAAMWQDIQKDHMAQIGQLETRLHSVSKAEINYYELAEALCEIPEILSVGWQQSKPDQKARLLNLMTSNITILNEEITIEWHEPFSNLGHVADFEKWWNTEHALRNYLAQHAEVIQAVQALVAA